MSIRENARIARAHYELFNQRDLERSAVLISPHIHWTIMPYNQCLKGHQAYQHLIQNITNAFPDAHLQITNLIATTQWVTTELTAQGTHTQPLHLSNSTIPPTNQPFWLPICEVIEINNKRIINARLYFDSTLFPSGEKPFTK
jgi:predicted ester cyclase